MYPEEIVIPMKEELTENGFTELLTPADVDNVLNEKGTTLVVINSVCGCIAGTARPGVVMAVSKGNKKPDKMTTSFAGFDIDAVEDEAVEQFMELAGVGRFDEDALKVRMDTRFDDVIIDY